MNELQKIAQSNEFTYLEKVAAIVDEFAAGNISGEEADAIAANAGISESDLLSVHNAVYGDNEDMTKVAHDIAEAATEALVKVAEDQNSTYLEKCASIADAFAAGAVTAEEGDAIASELGLDPEDVANVFTVAYGDELEKEASYGVQTAKNAWGKVSGLGGKVKDFYAKDINDAMKKNKILKKELGEGAKESKIYKLTKSKRNQLLRDAGLKIGGTAAGLGAAGYGAYKLFGNRNDR